MSGTLKARGAKASPSLADIGYLSNFAGNADGYILLSDLFALGYGVFFEDTGGWITGEAWTYVSAGSFSAVGDLTGKYAKGDRIRLVNNAATKYFYVIGVSFGAGITTITITGGSDYALVAGAISAPSYSKQVSPAGFPQWFAWTPGQTGFSVNPTTTTALFRIDGSTLSWNITQVGAGTSNATTFTFTGLPVASKNRASSNFSYMCRTYNNGAYVTTPGFTVVVPNSTTILVFMSLGTQAWTGSGGKFMEYGNGSYEF